MSKIEDELLKSKILVDVDSMLNSIKSTSDLYFVSLLALDKMTDSRDSKINMVAELAYLLDNQSFTNLLFYFEGQTIRIPTKEEVRESFQMILLHYHYNILGQSWDNACKELGYLNKGKLWDKYMLFLKSLEHTKLPDRVGYSNDL